MTKWKIGLVILGLLSAVGCGDSDSGDGDGTGDNTNGNGNTDTTSGANAPGTNGTDDDAGSTGDTAGGDSAGQMNGGQTAGGNEGGSDAGSSTGGAGACTNEADSTKLGSFDPGATAASCGMMCLENESCNTCYENDSNFSQISAPCRACWVTITRCVADKCVLGGGFPCLTDANSKACADCRTTNCNPDFVTCSGIDPENP